MIMMFVFCSISILVVVSLCFGIVGWIVLFFIGVIVVVICGYFVCCEICQIVFELFDGDGFVVIGLVLGYVQLVLSVVGMLFFWILLFGLFYLVRL